MNLKINMENKTKISTYWVEGPLNIGIIFNNLTLDNSGFLFTHHVKYKINIKHYSLSTKFVLKKDNTLSEQLNKGKSKISHEERDTN